MAKKKQETKVEEPVVEETVVMEKPVVEKEEPQKSKWEIKDRVYYLKGKKKPLSRMIKSCDLFWFDEEAGYEREIKYCQNQRTVFVDEMKGDQRLEHVIFRNGALHVPREQTTLQKFLSLYHPHKDKIYYEHKPVQIAKSQLDWLEFEVEALMLAKNLDLSLIHI